MAAIRNRVVGEVPLPSLDGLTRLRNTGKRLARLLGKQRELEILEFPLAYTGAKRARYQRAAENLLEGGITRRKAKVKCFVKFEKLEFKPEKPNPDPRAIQFRSPEYCVALGRFLRPIEHAVYKLKGGGILPPSRVIGKGLSQPARAALLLEKVQRFKSPCLITLDASRFDQHCSEPLLRIEHAFYCAANSSKEFAKLLSWQLKNKGRTSWGIRYETTGKRMSGDMNTGLGNCVLMVTMITTFVRFYLTPAIAKRYGERLVHWDMIDDGDDAILIVESKYLDLVLDLVKPAFLDFGHEIKVEKVARSMEEVEWCQARPIEYKPGKWKFVRDYRKVISNSLSGVKYCEPTRNSRQRLVNSIGLAEMILGLGIPVLQEYGKALVRNAGTERLLVFDSIDSYYYRLHNELRGLNRKFELFHPDPVTDCARQSYARAFGVSITEQLKDEDMLSKWSFNLLGDYHLNRDIDVAKWRIENPFSPEKYPPGEYEY